MSDHGFPIIQFTDEFVPPDTTYDSLVLMPENEESDGDEKEISRIQAERAMPIIGHIMNAIGIPMKVFTSDETDDSELWEAAERDRDASKRRTEI